MDVAACLEDHFNFQRMLIVFRAKNIKWVHIEDKQPIKNLSDFANFFPSHAFLRRRRKKALIRVKNRRYFENSVQLGEITRGLENRPENRK